MRRGDVSNKGVQGRWLPHCHIVYRTVRVVRYVGLQSVWWGMLDCSQCGEVCWTAVSVVRYVGLQSVWWGMLDCSPCGEVCCTAVRVVRYVGLQSVWWGMLDSLGSNIPHQTERYALTPNGSDGFGGIVVSILASGTQVCGSKPGRSRWIFRT